MLVNMDECLGAAGERYSCVVSLRLSRFKIKLLHTLHASAHSRGTNFYVPTESLTSARPKLLRLHRWGHLSSHLLTLSAVVYGQEMDCSAHDGP